MFSIVTEQKRVKNLQPLVPPTGTSRLAIIGEAPGEDEEAHGFPFVGKSGNFLSALLQKHHINRHECFIGNICQVRPPNNEIGRFKWDEWQIQEGLAALSVDLRSFNPTLCLLLGNAPLRAAKDKDSKVSSWRGSVFRSTNLGLFQGLKCIPTFHPAFVLREYSNFPLLNFDIKRTSEESFTSEIFLPQRELSYSLTPDEIIFRLANWRPDVRCSVDIEGGLPASHVNEAVKADSGRRKYIGWRCVALSDSPSRGFAIQWWKYSDHEKVQILRAFARLMIRPDVPKVLQNSLYDNFVLSYGYHIPIFPVVEDTMLKGWEIFSELPKGLSTQASIYTREPHWKDESMYLASSDNLAEGCARDAAVTLEVCEVQDSHIPGSAYTHYRANVDMLNPLLYMELRGINYDQENAQVKSEEIKVEYEKLGQELSEIAGFELRGPSGSVSSQRLCAALYQQGPFTYGSGKKKQTITEYKTSPYPPQYKKENGRKTERLTSDVEALLALRKKLPNDTFLNGILHHRHLEGLIETLGIKPDSDGRVRCGYNVVGTETGRLTCYTSPTGAGANLQTITKDLRLNYISDPLYDFFQCDLSGADGWTVAAHCARLGDPRMLEDYRAGLKPAKIIALLYAFGDIVNKLSTEQLLAWSDKRVFSHVEKLVGKWVYAGAKIVQHGTNYGMGIPTMQTNLMKRSYKETGTPIYLEHAQASALQRAYLSRYNIAIWHNWSRAKLMADGKLTSASGHTRVFFGRRTEPDIKSTLKEFLADEPQQNTTWATNLAMLKLWNDRENRIQLRTENTIQMVSGHVWQLPEDKTGCARLQSGALLIEPLHTVHDALCGQWPKFCRDWATARMHHYFDNTLTIAGIPIVIPFEGNYGPSWGEQPHKI